MSEHYCSRVAECLGLLFLRSLKRRLILHWTILLVQSWVPQSNESGQSLVWTGASTARRSGAAIRQAFAAFREYDCCSVTIPVEKERVHTKARQFFIATKSSRKPYRFGPVQMRV